MSKPRNIHFNQLKLEGKRKLRNGVLCEHWHDCIDNEYHLHFPDGTFINIGYEDCEGSVEITEPKIKE